MRKPLCWTVFVFCALAAFAERDVLAQNATEEGFTSLFNGKDLTGWTGDTAGYKAENSELVCMPGGNLYTEADYSDFNFRFDFKLTPGANNGVGIRVQPGAHAAYDAIEIQILDDTADKYKDIKPYQFHGSIYGIVPAKQGFLKPVGEWNTEEIIAEGNHFKIILNGETIVDADTKEATKDGMPDGKEHPGLFNTTGRIGFIGHHDVLYFRNIRVKSLAK